MSTTSADPNRLHGFVASAPAERLEMRSAAAGVQALALAVISRCTDTGVSATNSGAVFQLLDNMLANERFVSAVADALRTADGFDGVHTIDDLKLDAALSANSNHTDTRPVEIDELRLLGAPPTSGLVDDPICAATGNFFHHHTDFVLPGTSATLNLHRHYNSRAANRPGGFGAGWSSVFDMALLVPDTGRRTVRLADGAELNFEQADRRRWTTGDRRHHLLRQVGGRWELIVDPTGHRRFLFDDEGRLTGWRVGRTDVHLTYESSRVVAAIHPRSGRSLAINWHDDTIRSIVANDGRRLRYTYHEGLLMRAESASGWFDYEYENRRLSAAVDPDGVTEFRNTYDVNGRVTRQVSPFGRTTEYHYPTAGTTVISDERGVRQAMVHDTRGNLTSIVDHDGSSMVLVYDAADRATSVTSKSGAVWRHEFEPTNGDLVRRLDPDGYSQSWEYDDRRRVVSVTDRGGGVTRLCYRADHTSPCTVTAPDGSTTRTRLNRWGLPVAITNADGGVQRIDWNVDGQPTHIVEPNGAATRFEYNAVGQLVTLRRSNRAPRHVQYDDAGRVVVLAEGNRQIEFGYTSAGRPRSGVTTGGALWSAEYGDHGAASTVFDGDGNPYRLHYDSCGNLTRFDAPDGGEAQFVYDAVGRCQQAGLNDGSSWLYDYDVDGFLVGLTDPTGRHQRRTVDAWGRTVSSVADDIEVQFGYHPTGAVSTVTMPDGRTWSTDVDATGRMTEVTDPTGRTIHIDESAVSDPIVTPPPTGPMRFDRRGLLASATDPAGLTTYFGYDVCGRLVKAVAPGARITTWEYDGVGRLARTTDPAGVVTEITRDLAGGVTAVRRGDVESTLPMPAGALTPVTLGQLAADPLGTCYQHDTAGRLIAVIPPHTAPTRLAYGDDGLLTSEDGPARNAEFHYDAGGRVVMVEMGDGSTTTITYDSAGRRAEERSSSGSTVSYEWDAFDRLVAVSSSDSEQHDRIGQLVQLGCRVLDPATRQFLTPDPLIAVPGTNGSASAYTYSWNDPARFCDPSGLRPISLLEYQAIREREEQGRLGQAWEAISDDPWGFVAVGALVVVATAVGGPVATGFVIGVVAAGGIGVATGNLSPELLLVGGLTGAVTLGSATWLQGASPVANIGVNAAIGAGDEVATALATGQPLRLTNVVAAAGGSAASAGLLARLGPAANVPQAMLSNGAAEATNSVVSQTLTGHMPDASDAVLAFALGSIEGKDGHPIGSPDLTGFDITPALPEQLQSVPATALLSAAKAMFAPELPTNSAAADDPTLSDLVSNAVNGGHTGAGVP